MLDLNINKRLLYMKGHYFLFNAGTGPVVSFMSVYAKQLGFSSVTVGIIYTILPIAGMLAKTIMGGIADRFQCKKTIFLSAILLTAVSFLIMNFTNGVPTEQKMTLACSHQTFIDTCANDVVTGSCAVEKVKSATKSPEVKCKLSCPVSNDEMKTTLCKDWNATQFCDNSTLLNVIQFSAVLSMEHNEQLGNCTIFKINRTTFDDKNYFNPICPRVMNSVCDVHCESYAINDLIRKSKLKENQIYSSPSFWLLLLTYLLTWVCQAVVVSIGDAICFELLGDEPNKYGYQRLWGSLGWGFSSALAGLLIDHFSEGGEKNYTAAFALGIIILLINFADSCFINYHQQYKSPSILKDVGRTVKNLRVFIFLIWCTFIGMCTGLLWNFFLWVVEDLATNMGCDSFKSIKTLQGLIMAIQCLCGELPFFFLSGSILKRIGHVNTMSLILLAIGVRFTLYSVIPNPWWFLPVEIMNGITFGLAYATMASYASIAAPPGTEATVQGLVGAMFEGVGVSLGSFIGGILMKKFGGPSMFRIFGLSSFVMCLLHSGLQLWMNKRHVLGKDVVSDYATPQVALQMVEDSAEDK